MSEIENGFETRWKTTKSYPRPFDKNDTGTFNDALRRAFSVVVPVRTNGYIGRYIRSWFFKYAALALPDRERPRSSAASVSTLSDSGPVLLLPVGFPILLCPRGFKPGSFDLGLNLSNCEGGGIAGDGVFAEDVDPAELRFDCSPELCGAGEGPTERLPLVEVCRCAEATGRKVGVEGREAEVGIELTVEVLVLPSDERRD